MKLMCPLCGCAWSGTLYGAYTGKELGGRCDDMNVCPGRLVKYDKETRLTWPGKLLDYLKGQVEKIEYRVHRIHNLD